MKEDRRRFLGRTLNTDTMMWEFQDGSGVAFPDEKRMEIEAYAQMSRSPFPYNKGWAMAALGTIFAYKEKMLAVTKK